MQRAKRLKLEEIAQMTHTVNKMFCKSIGDDSQPDWQDAPDWQRQSAMKGVEYALQNPDSTPKQMHENWMKEKEANGWTYGEEKDPEAKTHPCMVAYSKLSKEQQAKDLLFINTVRAMDYLRDDNLPGR